MPVDEGQTRYASRGDTHVAFQVHGAGPRALVLVPGLTSHLGVQWEDERMADLQAVLDAADAERAVLFGALLLAAPGGSVRTN